MFLSAEPLASLEKQKRTKQKSEENRKTNKKQGNEKGKDQGVTNVHLSNMRFVVLRAISALLDPSRGSWLPTLLDLRKPPPATEPFRGLRARNPKRVKNESKKCLPDPPVPGAQKVRKESKKSQKWPFLTRFWLFFDSFRTFGPLGPEGPGALFWLVFDSFGIPGPKAPKWLCSWWGLSQYLT